MKHSRLGVHGPPTRSTPPPTGNPGSATEISSVDLTERVETLEGVTSQLSDATSAQSERISNTEEDVLSLDQRVEDLESGGGTDNLTGME